MGCSMQSVVSRRPAMGCHHRTQSPKLHLHRTMTLFPQTPSSHSAGHRRRQVSPPAPKSSTHVPPSTLHMPPRSPSPVIRRQSIATSAAGVDGDAAPWDRLRVPGNGGEGPLHRVRVLVSGTIAWGSETETAGCRRWDRNFSCVFRHCRPVRRS